MVFIGLSFFSVYFSLQEHKKDLVQEAIKEKIHLAETINETLTSPVWVYRLALIPGIERSFIEGMAQFREVEYLKVVDSDGVVAESSIEEERGNIIKDPDIYKVLRQKKELVKDEVFQGRKIKLIIYPGYASKTIWIGFTLTGIEKTIKGMLIRDVVVFSLSSIIIFLVLFFFLKRKVISPLKKITGLCQKVRKGNLKVQVKVKSKTEIGQLAQSFNAMVRDLAHYQYALKEERNILEIKVKARTKELRELADLLEERVKERTKELQKRVDELERFHRLTVGRELRMVELKKEIKKLKEE